MRGSAAPRGVFTHERLVVLTDVLDRLLNVVFEPLVKPATDVTMRRCLSEVPKFDRETWELLLKSAGRICGGTGAFFKICMRALEAYLDDYFGHEAHISFLMPTKEIPAYLIKQFIIRFSCDPTLLSDPRVVLQANLLLTRQRLVECVLRNTLHNFIETRVRLLKTRLLKTQTRERIDDDVITLPPPTRQPRHRMPRPRPIPKTPVAMSNELDGSDVESEASSVVPSVQKMASKESEKSETPADVTPSSLSDPVVTEAQQDTLVPAAQPAAGHPSLEHSFPPELAVPQASAQLAPPVSPQLVSGFGQGSALPAHAVAHMTDPPAPRVPRPPW